MRREGTREKIAQACLELLNTTSLESLRTQDLMAKAGVSRSSFYRAFPDKYAVATWIYQKEADTIMKELPDLRNWKEWTYALHTYMRSHRQFFRNIASYRGQNSFGEFLCKFFLGNIQKTRKDVIRTMTEEQKYSMYAFSLVGAQATVDWILNDLKPDDETLIRLLEACIPSCIRFLYE